MIQTKFQERIQQVKKNIADACAKAGRNPAEVKLIVVTKSAEIDAIKQVIQLGETNLGENRAQQLKKVTAQIDEFLKESEDNPQKNINWHMIGHIQRNKVRQVLALTSLIHSVDTLRLAEEINDIAGKMNLTPKILLQINTSMEPQKYGVPVGAVTHLAEQIVTMPNLKLCGLMTMAPLTKDSEIIRSCFRRTREIFLEMKSDGIVKKEFTQISMGMSNDYEIAVEEGATLVRVGSAIFAS